MILVAVNAAIPFAIMTVTMTGVMTIVIIDTGIDTITDTKIMTAETKNVVTIGVGNFNGATFSSSNRFSENTDLTTYFLYVNNFSTLIFLSLIFSF